MTTDTWNGADANWNTAADWSDGLPDASSDVVVETGDLTVTTNISVASITNSRGDLQFEDGLECSVSGAVTNDSTLSVNGDRSAPQAGGVGTSLTIGGTLTNDAGLYIGGSYTAGTDTVSAAALVNENSIVMFGSGSAVSILDILSAAGALGGVFELSGASRLEFASGEVSTIRAGTDLTLNGVKAVIADQSDTGSNSALKALRNIGGVLALEHGAAVSTTGALTVSASLEVNDASHFVVDGAVTLSGELDVGANDMTTASRSTAIIEGNLALTGQVDLGGSQYGDDTIGGGTLRVEGNVSATPPASGRFVAEFFLSGNATLELDGTVSSNVTIYLDSDNDKLILKDAAGLSSSNIIDMDGTDISGIFAQDASVYTILTGVVGRAYTAYDYAYNSAGGLIASEFFGVTGRPYSSYEFEYDGAGTLTGTSYFFNITGKDYTGEELDKNAAGQTIHIIYTGFKGTGYTTHESDYSNGVLQDAIFSGVTGQTYTAWERVYVAGQVGEVIYDLATGAHNIAGLVDGLTLTSIYNDRMTGGGQNETFLFGADYGRDVITDFATQATGTGHDVISLSTSEFSDFAAVLGAATNSGANVVLTAADGDKITIDGMSKTTLAGLSADFTFHS